MATYAKSAKDDIRMNKNGIAEKLGFVAGIIRGRKHSHWLHALRFPFGESGTNAAATFRNPGNSYPNFSAGPQRIRHELHNWRNLASVNAVRSGGPLTCWL
jgi:hypothetical protein